ncbi:hypothetical protein [Tabrizicola sp.]|uniref:hypothetical protein n=1 Tax=Tabrizicola sp. TaxID=2005166 RepID=UPI002FDEF4C8
MQLDHDTSPSRHERRALLSGQRTRIQKHTAFGRAIVLAVEYGPEPQDSRIVYQHMTKGVVDGRRRMGNTGCTLGWAD